MTVPPTPPDAAADARPVADKRKRKMPLDDPAFQDQMAAALDDIDRYVETLIEELEAGRMSASMVPYALQVIRTTIRHLTIEGDIEDMMNAATPIQLSRD